MDVGANPTNETTLPKKILLFITGVVAGVVGTWVLSLGYLTLAVKGHLLVPFLIAGAVGLFVAKKRRWELGIGIILGALLETAFFAYLFYTYSQGLEGL